MRATLASRWQRRGLGAFALSSALLGGCPKPEPAKEPAPERTTYLAQPCPELALGDEPIDADKARLFVEVADVSTRKLPQPIGRWLAENAVKVRSTANLVAFPNVPTSMPWGQCVDAVCSSMQLSITLTAEPSGAPAKVLLETALEAKHQEPVVLPPSPAVSDGSVVVTAYLLQKHDDLQRIMACQARRAPSATE